MKKRTADDQTLNQLEELGYLGSGSHNHERPLLICDVDEVILHLVDPFVEVLQERGFELKSHSFKLTGNVFHRDSGAEATQQEVWAGLTQLFEEQSERQGIVESAADELKNLNEQIDIVFLTNMPHEFGDIRRNYLAQNDMTYPLITNTGSKVPAIEIMQSRSQNPIGFIDDTPKNLEQVRDGASDIHLFHFMANEEFRQLAGDIDGAHFSTGHWPTAKTGILSVLVENGSRT